MKKRLPAILKKVLVKRFLLPLIILVISSITLYLAVFAPSRKTALQILEFYPYRNTDTPGVYAVIRNNSSARKKISGQLFVSDLFAAVQRNIELGNIGFLEPGEEREVVFNWKENWKGGGLGDIRLVIRDQEGFFEDRSTKIAVLPKNLNSIRDLSLFASAVVGMTVLVSRFA